MKRTNFRDLVDRALGGKLHEHLRAERAAGASYEAIAASLRDHDIVVAGETVRRWCRDLGIGDIEVGAA